MISAYEWDEYFLLVCFRIRGDSYTLLLQHTSQEQFFEYLSARHRGRQIADLMVIQLTETSAELLTTQWAEDGIENRVLIEGEIQ